VSKHKPSHRHYFSAFEQTKAKAYLKLLLQPAHARLQLRQRPVLGRHSSAQRRDLGACSRHVSVQHSNAGLTRLLLGFLVGQAAFGFTEL
jgi:hypothetical protein